MLRIVSASGQPIWQRVLHYLVLTLALVSVLQFLVLAYFRLPYPFEMEWLEGASIDAARRIIAGHALYGEPDVSFIPGVYNPLYYYLSALLMRVIGIGFLAPRLLSFLSTVGCFVALFLIVATESRHMASGLVAAGAYAVTFHFSGGWMDIARVDSLFLLLILLAFLVSQRYPNKRGMAVSALLYVSAYYAKQNALLIIAVMLLVSLILSRGRTWPQWFIVVGVGLLTFLALDLTSDGWFSFYTFDMVTYRTIDRDIWFFWHSLVPKMWPLLLVAAFYVSQVALQSFQSPVPEKVFGLWQNIGFGCALLLSSWAAFLQKWAYTNNFMPVCAGLGILAGLGYARSLSPIPASHKWLRSVCLVVVPVLLVLHFLLLYYSPCDQLPTGKGRQVWEQFISRLRDHPGEVLIFNHGFAGYMAGKSTFLHSSFYTDAVGGGTFVPRSEDHRWRRDRVRQVLEQAIRQQVFEWVFAGESSDWSPYYLSTGEEPVVFYPVTGPPAEREVFFIKNPVARGGVLHLNDTRFGFLLQEGWSIPETWGRWAIGTQAAIQIALEEGHNYELSIEAFPFCPPEFAGQTMKVRWNALLLGTHVFTSCESQWITFDLPAQEITDGFGTLWFDFGTAIAPAEVGLSGDGRPLAVGFVSLNFAQK